MNIEGDSGVLEYLNIYPSSGSDMWGVSKREFLLSALQIDKLQTAEGEQQTKLDKTRKLILLTNWQPIVVYRWADLSLLI